MAAHTDDELFDAEITHNICRSSLCLGLKRRVSAFKSMSHKDFGHHFERWFGSSSFVGQFTLALF